MPFLDSLYVAFLCITIVMLALACLFILIKLFSLGIGIAAKRKKKTGRNVLPTSESTQNSDSGSEFASGVLVLNHVDERTAAIIMAIVSDETGIPLSELVFKSITAIERNADDSREVSA